MGNKDTFLYNKFDAKDFPGALSGEAFLYVKRHCIFPLFVKEGKTKSPFGKGVYALRVD